MSYNKNMNESSGSLSKFTKMTTITISILGVFIILGGYMYYQNNIINQEDYIEITTDIDSLSDSELIIQTLGSLPKIDPEDTMTEDEIKQILKNNQIKTDENETLADNEYSLIIKNNAPLEDTEN